MAPKKQMGAKAIKPMVAKKMVAAKKKGGKIGQRARLAQTLKKMH